MDNNDPTYDKANKMINDLMDDVCLLLVNEKYGPEFDTLPVHAGMYVRLTLPSQILAAGLALLPLKERTDVMAELNIAIMKSAKSMGGSLGSMATMEKEHG